MRCILADLIARPAIEISAYLNRMMILFFSGLCGLCQKARRISVAHSVSSSAL
jgi:hypothetical protein